MYAKANRITGRAFVATEKLFPVLEASYHEKMKKARDSVTRTADMTNSPLR